MRSLRHAVVGGRGRGGSADIRILSASALEPGVMKVADQFRKERRTA